MHVGSPGSSDRFGLDARIGGGGMGEIYKATDRVTGEAVALKLLRPTATAAEKNRFMREIAVLADLRHPNIVQYVSHGTWTDGRLFFAMEWLDGEDLGKRQRHSPLGMRDAVEVVRRASAAMAAIHSRGVIHRDLKLANIFLVRGRGTAIKLIDFGVVRTPQREDYETEHGAIIGTPHYMAPEQAKGEPIDARADVYSLGSVLFRLTTGRNVFETEHIIALLGRLVIEDPPRASSIRFDVPETLDEVIHRAVSRDRAGRYSDGGEFARALARVGTLNNDPPATDRSASVVRKARPASARDTITGTDSEIARQQAKERRVVAAVAYDVGSESLPEHFESELRNALGDEARIVPLLGHQSVAVLGLDRSVGDEAIRAARAALLVTKLIPTAKAVASVGHSAVKGTSVVGEALDRAGQQLAKAEPGAARVDETARAALAGRFVVQEDAEGGVLVREDTEGAGSRTLLGRPTPTVGRQKEIGLLIGFYGELVEEGSPRAAVVIGPAGVGKSRLRAEVLHRVETHDPPPDVLFCRCDSMSRGSSLSALGRALRTRMEIHDGEAPLDQVHKVKQHLFPRLPKPIRFLSAFLGELVGVPFPDDMDEPLRAARASTQLMQSRLRMAMEAFVRSQADQRPQLLVLEDVHWADETTLTLVDWLLGCQDLRFGVLAYGRPEVATRYPDLWDKKNVTRLTLAPLSPPAAERLIEAALPDSTPELRADLTRRAGGNALFLEELIRSTVEGREELPLTVQALIQTRLDYLSPAVREALRAASVFGHVFWTGGLEAVLGREVDIELDELERAELVTRHGQSRIAGQEELVFRQALVRDAAYASLLDEDRESLHLAAGAWLESAGDVDLGLIARHADAGGDYERASLLYARATRQAYQNGAQLETGLDLAERGLSCGAAGGIRAQLLLAKAQVCLPLGRIDEAIVAAHDAADLAPAGSDLWAESQRFAGEALIAAGRSQEGDACLSGALTPMHRATIAPTLVPLLMAARVRGLVDLGRAEEALQIADEAVLAANAAGATDGALRAADARLFALMHMGNPSGVLEQGNLAIEAAEAAGDAVLATRARLNVASTLNVLGAFDEARPLLERALTDAHRRRMRILEAFALHNLGMTEARRGDIDRGIERQRQSIRIADETGAARLQIHARVYEVHFLLWRGGPGDHATALSVAEAVERDSAEAGRLRYVAAFCMARVRLARREPGSLEAARLAYESISSGPVEEWEEAIRLTYVQALLVDGRDGQADVILQEAVDALEARLAALVSPAHRQTYARLEECRLTLELARERLGTELSVPLG